MLIRRRRTKLSEPQDKPASPHQTTDVQRALRLGWAIAETFGRLRVFQAEFANRRNDTSEMPRFSFSNSDLSGAQQLEVSYRRLVELAVALGLHAPDVPELAELLSSDQPPVLGVAEKKRIHERLEAWSRACWIQLNVRSAELGRAMTYGGSMADTYWYMAEPSSPAFLTGRQSIDALLRPHRLSRMQERLGELNEAFTPELCDAIGHSLGAWVLDEAKLAWATATNWEQLGVAVEGTPRRTPPQQLHFNLFRQVRTWRDLVFEARQPLDYVSPGFRRRANLLAGTITIVGVVAVAFAVGLIVFTLFNVGLNFVRPRFNIGQGEQFVEVISVFVSLVSTVAVVVAGLLARASRAVEQFDAWLEAAIIRRRVREQTTVPWNDPPRPVDSTTLSGRTAERDFLPRD